MKKWKAVIYCRIAHEDTIAMEHQKVCLENYAKENGFQVVSMISEFGSGTDYSREGIRKLSEMAATGKIDLVLIHSLSRLGRDSIATAGYLHWLKEQHVEVVCADGTLTKLPTEAIYDLYQLLKMKMIDASNA